MPTIFALTSKKHHNSIFPTQKLISIVLPNLDYLGHSKHNVSRKNQRLFNIYTVYGDAICGRLPDSNDNDCWKGITIRLAIMYANFEEEKKEYISHRYICHNFIFRCTLPVTFSWKCENVTVIQKFPYRGHVY